MAAAGTSSASGAGSYVRVAPDQGVGYATVVGLPGVAYQQDQFYLDSNFEEVTPTADTEFVTLINARTGRRRLVSLAELAILLA